MIKNRIISYGSKPADQFLVNPKNFTIHPEEQQKVMEDILQNIGWVGVVIESANSGYVLDGHERIWEALQDNSSVPYLLVDLTQEEEDIVLATYNATAHMAHIDKTKGLALIEEIRASAAEKWEEEVAQAVVDEYGLAATGGYVPPSPAGDDSPSAHEITCPHCGEKFYE